jgi:hypothetical protein
MIVASVNCLIVNTKVGFYINQRIGGVFLGTIELVEMHTQSKRYNSITIIDQETSIIEDTYLIAALLTFDPTINYVPLQDPSGKVSFEVYGKIADGMGQFYAGDAASLKTYIRNLKMLRSAVFALRSSSVVRVKR